jgi:hypothetical protein
MGLQVFTKLPVKEKEKSGLFSVAWMWFCCGVLKSYSGQTGRVVSAPLVVVVVVLCRCDFPPFVRATLSEFVNGVTQRFWYPDKQRSSNGSPSRPALINNSFSVEAFAADSLPFPFAHLKTPFFVTQERPVAISRNCQLPTLLSFACNPSFLEERYRVQFLSPHRETKNKMKLPSLRLFSRQRLLCTAVILTR